MRRLWYTPILMLGLVSLVPVRSGAAPAAPSRPSAATGADQTKPNPTTKPGDEAAPIRKPSPSESEGNGTPSSAPYPLVTVSVNGQQLATQGILLNGRTLLPIIDLVDKLGGKAVWDAQTKTVWAAFPRQKRTLRLVVGTLKSQIYRYDAKDPHRTGSLIATTQMDQPPMLLGGYVVAPADAVANVTRAKVFYRPDTKQVSIVSPTGQQTRSR